MIRKYILISISLLLMIMQIGRAEGNLTSAEERLQILLNQKQTVSADFEQTVTDARGEVIQASEGRVFILRPNLLRWEVRKPNQQIIVSNGKKLWFYELDLAQVVIKDLDAAIANTPAVLLTGQAEQLGDSYTIRHEEANGVRDIFYLFPKSDDGMFQELEIRFDEGDMRNLRLVDNLGQITAIRFRNVVSDMELDREQFRIEIPNDVDVIDETEH